MNEINDLRCRASWLLPILLFASACSDHALEPPAIESCKNVIRYELSGEVDVTATHGYDDQGHLTEYIETNAEGKEIFRLSRMYDERGRRKGQVIDTTRFDSQHREMTWEYDEAERVIRSTYDGWGSDKSFLDTRFTYDDQGRRSTLESKKNGVLYNTTKVVYLEGEPLVVEERHFNGTDEAFAYGFRYFLGQGRWLERSEIFNAEVVQSAEWFTYEDQSKGRVSRRDLDSGADNIFDEFDHIFWNEDDLVEKTEFDLDASGQVTQRNQYEYDQQGRMIRRTWFILDQGTLEFLTTIDWADDVLRHIERIDNATGQVIEAWDFEYGCNNQWPMDVNIVPIQGFRYEMQALPFNVDSATWWQSFDAL